MSVGFSSLCAVKDNQAVKAIIGTGVLSKIPDGDCSSQMRILVFYNKQNQYIKAFPFPLVGKTISSFEKNYFSKFVDLSKFDEKNIEDKTVSSSSVPWGLVVDASEMNSHQDALLKACQVTLKKPIGYKG